MKLTKIPLGQNHVFYFIFYHDQTELSWYHILPEAHYTIWPASGGPLNHPGYRDQKGAMVSLQHLTVGTMDLWKYFIQNNLPNAHHPHPPLGERPPLGQDHV